MLHDGDILLSMGDGMGGSIEFGSGEQLREAVHSAKAGDTIRLEVLRQGQILSIPITLDLKPFNVDKQIEEFTARRRQLEAMRRMVEESVDILVSGMDLQPFGHLLHEAWQTKRSLSPQGSVSSCW